MNHRKRKLTLATVACLALTAFAPAAALAEWNPSFTTDAQVFTNPTDYYYPTVVKQGGTYHMWFQNHSGDDDVWYTCSSSPDGSTGWSTPVQCLAGGSAMAGWNTHPSVIDTGTGFRIYYGDSARGIDVAETSYANPTAWSIVGTDVVTRGSAGAFHQDSASVHTISQWYDAFVYRYGDHYEGYFASDFGLHYGTSADGITGWTAMNSVPNTSPPPDDTTGPPVFQKGAAGQWDSYTMGKASVLRLADDEYHMFYGSGQSGDPKAYAAGIGYATSTDGIHWTRDPDNPLFHITDGQAYRDRRTYTPWVFIDGDVVRMYFSAEASSSGTPDSIGLANAPFGQTQPIPEPATIVNLIALGLIMAAATVYRRHRRAQKA